MFSSLEKVDGKPEDEVVDNSIGQPAWIEVPMYNFGMCSESQSNNNVITLELSQAWEKRRMESLLKGKL